MEGMAAKYKRREEELVKRVQEKEAAQQRVYSTFKSFEKQVQASPRLEDTVAQTEDFTLGLDVSLQTDKHKLEVKLEDTEAQTDVSPTKDVGFQTEKRSVTPLQYYQTRTEISSMTEFSTELGTAEVNLTSITSAPSTSAAEEMTCDTTTLTVEEKECLKDLRKCQSVIDQNNTVIKNVKELHVLYTRDISRRIKRDPKMHNKMRRKEEELFQVKAELHAVEDKLRDTKEELHKLKEKSISDRNLASKKVQTPQKMKGCLACSELADKVEDLQNKLAAMKAADDSTKFRMNMEFHKIEMDHLTRSSHELNKKYLELKEEYVCANFYLFNFILIFILF
ncbi:uncharacterized protein [Onthophagus taurus]|uniref:uncharacterized protein n=1 Tax=Onthophagus taurus TaxID=166361 RepID=UPI0039BE6133